MTLFPRNIRRAVAVFALGYAVFVVYVTALPFEFDLSFSAARARLEAVTPNPFERPDGRRPSIADMGQNIALFLPLGALIAAVRRPRGGAARIGRVILASAAAGLVLSVLVETLQLFTINRTSSWNDVVTNTFGAALGAGIGIGALALIGRADRMKLEPQVRAHSLALAIAVVLMAVAAWHPFDPTLDVGAIGSKVRRLAGDPWQRGPFRDEGLDFVRHALFAGVLTAWLTRLHVRSAALIALCAGANVAGGLELSQILIRSRMTGLHDLSVGLAGVVVGVLGWLVSRAWSRRWLATVVILASVAGTAVMILTPFTLAAERQPFGVFPFLTYYRSDPRPVLSHAVELWLGFFPIGFALAAQLRRAWLLPVFAVSLGLGGSIEYAQGWIVGRFPDVTDVAVLVTGALSGAFAGRWVSEMARDDSAHTSHSHTDA